MISDRDLGLIKAFVFSNEYKVLEQMILEAVKEIEERSPIRDTEWETVKSTLLYQGEKMGFLRVLQKLNELASKSHE